MWFIYQNYKFVQLFGSELSEFMYELPKTRTVPKYPVCSLLDDAENVKSHLREYVTVQGLKGLKCTVVSYFWGRIFNPTNLWNYMAPSTE